MLKTFNELQTIPHDLPSSSKNEERLYLSTIPELLDLISGQYFRGKRKVLSVIEKNSNMDNKSLISMARIGKLAGMSRRQAIRNTKALSRIYFNGFPLLMVTPRGREKPGHFKCKVNGYQLNHVFKNYEFHVDTMRFDEFKHHKKYNEEKRHKAAMRRANGEDDSPEPPGCISWDAYGRDSMDGISRDLNFMGINSLGPDSFGIGSKTLNYDSSNDLNLGSSGTVQEPYVTLYSRGKELINYNYLYSSFNNKNINLNNYNLNKRIYRNKSERRFRYEPKFEIRGSSNFFESKMEDKFDGVYSIDELISFAASDNLSGISPKRGSTERKVLRIQSLLGTKKGNISHINADIVKKYGSFTNVSDKLTSCLREMCMLGERDSIVVNGKGEYAVIGLGGAGALLRSLNTTFFGTLLVLAFGKDVINAVKQDVINGNLDIKQFVLMATRTATEKNKRFLHFFDKFITDYRKIISIMISMGAENQCLTIDGQHTFNSSEHQIKDELIKTAMHTSFTIDNKNFDKEESKKVYERNMSKFSQIISEDGSKPLSCYIEDKDFISQLESKLDTLSKRRFTCAESELIEIEAEIKKVKRTIKFTKSLCT